MNNSGSRVGREGFTTAEGVIADARLFLCNMSFIVWKRDISKASPLDRPPEYLWTAPENWEPGISILEKIGQFHSEQPARAALLGKLMAALYEPQTVEEAALSALAILEADYYAGIAALTAECDALRKDSEACTDEAIKQMEAREAAEAECEALKHDIERYIAIASRDAIARLASACREE